MCTLGRDTLSAYWDLELGARDREFVRLHLAGCSDCLRELDAVKKSTNRLRVLTVHRAPPCVARNVQRELLRERWRRFAGVAAALLIGSLAFITETAPRPEPPAAVLPAAAPTPIFTICAADLGTVREEVDGLLADLHAPILIGAPDLGSDPALKDTCVTTYLNDAERDALERHVDRLTGRESKSWCSASTSSTRRRLILRFEEFPAALSH